MQVKDVMSKSLAFCTKDTSLTDVARMMVDNDCGAIPVVESNQSRKPVGMITDRDIVCRTLADGKDPFQMAAGDCMTAEVFTVSPDAGLEECGQVMKDHQVRRVACGNRLQQRQGARGRVAAGQRLQRHVARHRRAIWRLVCILQR